MKSAQILANFVHKLNNFLLLLVLCDSNFRIEEEKFFIYGTYDYGIDVLGNDLVMDAFHQF